LNGVLVLKDVACVRGRRLLFERLSLRLGPGEAALVTGPNGAGKSSLIRLAAGLLRPASGNVERAEAALADEHLALDERQALGRALAFWTPDGAAGMAAMGLGHLVDVPVRILSAGQRRRASLARVVASGSPLWLLDEPASGLDEDGLARLDAAMAAHRSAGGAILAASHQPLALAGAEEVALG
jgi:heme exporter protein A